MTSSKLLFLAAATLLGGCAVDHADIPSGPTKTLSDQGPSQDRDLAQAGDVALPGADEVRIYVAGGADVTGAARAEVYSAAIRDGGTLGPWRAEANLPSASAGLSLVRAASSILAVRDGDVLAGIDDARGLAQWRTIDKGTTGANAGVATDGASLLVLGGELADGRFATGGLLASLTTEGIPGDFVATPAFPSARSHVGTARLGRTVFAIGGATEQGDALDEVLSAHVKDTGSLDDWRPAPSLPRALRGHAVAAAGDNLLVLGGTSSGTPERGVYVSHVADDASLGAWTDAGTLPAGVEGHCVVASGANLFVIGGGTDSARATSDVLVTTVNMNGTIGAWRKLATLPVALSHAGCAVR